MTSPCNHKADSLLVIYMHALSSPNRIPDLAKHICWANNLQPDMSSSDLLALAVQCHHETDGQKGTAE